LQFFQKKYFLTINSTILLFIFAAGLSAASAPPDRQAYFGGLHVHTAWSLDTFQLGLRTTPEDAYRFARGESITHVNGEKIRLASGPLDFLAVADHSEYMGMARTLHSDKDSPIYKADFVRLLESDDIYTVTKTRMGIQKSVATNDPLPELLTPELRSYPWKKTIEIANRYYEPNKFTTFAAFEWTSMPERANLHRVVIFGNNKVLPEYPLTLFDSEDPVDLWHWQDKLRTGGTKVLAIPHNSNISNGRMFPVQLNGSKLTQEYIEQRLRNEPLVEIMQVKGASETHPSLSPNDEWADFAINEALLGLGGEQKSRINGGYIREALRNGLVIQTESGANPYAFGVVASSDTHSTVGTYEEQNYFGSHGATDSTPELRLNLTNKTPKYAHVGRPVRMSLQKRLARNGAGLAGVWAEENTRESIFAALERKETFGTSGPRIRVRIFGGWNFSTADTQDEDMLANAGYLKGVPMGGVLPERTDSDAAPVFLLAALMDPDSAPLQRLQIIKGWVENGKAEEAVFDVLCAGGVSPDAATNRCPDNKAGVNLKDCSYSRDAGSSSMSGTWTDQDFDASQPAFYYIRVLENPTCRWSTWDAVRLGVKIPEYAPPTIQERAWTSPIWYQP
jgi:hypothetical protein